MPERQWTDDEVKRAHDFHAVVYSYDLIDKMLRRRVGSTKRRPEGHNIRHISIRASDDLLAERDAIAAAREQRALTENICDDPPPGYSALHGKIGLR
jgi:hypothetical protein